MPLGLAPAFPDPSSDPSSLALTGLWRGSYNAADPMAHWLGVASAGTSGNYQFHDNSSPTHDPSNGIVVNGYTSLWLTGSTKGLVAADNSTIVQGLQTFFGATSGSGWILYYNPSIGGASGTGLGDTSGRFTLNISGVNAQLQTYDTSANNTLTVNEGNGYDTWNLTQFTITGTSIGLRQNGGTLYHSAGTVWTTPINGPYASNFTMALGQQSSGGFAGYVLDVGVSNQLFSLSQFDNIRSYCLHRYGVSV